MLRLWVAAGAHGRYGGGAGAAAGRRGRCEQYSRGDGGADEVTGSTGAVIPLGIAPCGFGGADEFRGMNATT